nr:uncharacterized protein LOC124810614 isoform X1 [Hydra vulgaris]
METYKELLTDYTSKIPCTLCNKFSVNDGSIICSQCLSSSSDIEDLNMFVTTGLNLFTKKSIMEIASSQLLKSFYSGQLYSYRHNWFIAGGEDKKNLSNGDLLSLLSEDQSHDLFNAFVLAFNKLKDSDYVFKVLMPESIVFLFANASNVSRIKAEVALSAYISERDKKRFCSSPEAYCTTASCMEAFAFPTKNRLFLTWSVHKTNTSIDVVLGLRLFVSTKSCMSSNNTFF